VHSDDLDWTKRAKKILEQTGAQDISSTTVFNATDHKIDSPLGYTATGSGCDTRAAEVQRLLG